MAACKWILLETPRRLEGVTAVQHLMRRDKGGVEREKRNRGEISEKRKREEK